MGSALSGLSNPFKSNPTAPAPGEVSVAEPRAVALPEGAKLGGGKNRKRRSTPKKRKSSKHGKSQKNNGS